MLVNFNLQDEDGNEEEDDDVDVYYGVPEEYVDYVRRLIIPPPKRQLISANQILKSCHHLDHLIHLMIKELSPTHHFIF
jgi:hypothetical protein